MVEAIESSARHPALLDQRVDHRRVGQGAGVAELVGRVLGDLAQDAAHDLARAGLGQARRPLDVVGRGSGADLGADLLHQFLAQLLARSEEHTSELQSLMRISYAVFCLKKKNE